MLAESCFRIIPSCVNLRIRWEWIPRVLDIGVVAAVENPIELLTAVECILSDLGDCRCKSDKFDLITLEERTARLFITTVTSFLQP